MHSTATNEKILLLAGFRLEAEDEHTNVLPFMPDELTPTPEEDATVDGGETPTEAALPGSSPATGFIADKPSVVIGRYKLLKELGKGGFGIVWQAEQTEPIRREVALKIIKPGMDSREIIARFEAERQALALMDHPNIAAVLDAGTTDRGLPYFVMELVKGRSITDYADEHKLTIRERLELFIPVCQAVQHAHQKAILHRDLKPSNILVTEVDGKPVPKVIDFGIAKALGVTGDAVLQASLAHTREGMIVGTPQYMSPEQAGSVPDVDTRSDIYTLGVILYELLVGDTPLSRERLRKAAFDEVLRVIRESEPLRPSSRFLPITDMAKTTASQRLTEPRKLGHALRGDLDWILLKALEKDRARRYDTANAFAQDLQRHLNDEPVSAGPPSAGYRLRKLVRRNRLAFGAAACILILLTAGIAASTWQAVRATKAEKLAEGRRMQAEAAATQARENLSQSDFLQALRSINDDRTHDALAQLSRSLALYPKNEAALCRLTTLLTYHSFPRPVSRVKHDSGVQSAQFSPDGKRIVTASWDMTARIWDAQTGQPMTDPMKHDGMVKVASFSPDGIRIVTATWDHKAARVWDAQSGQALTDPLKHDDEVWSAQFSPDGKRIVTASEHNAQVWDVQSGQPLTKLGGGKSAQFSPDSKRIVTASKDGARVWDAQTGQPLTEPMEHDVEAESAQFSPDGKRIVTASGIWDAQSGKPLPGGFGGAESAQFSPDGKRIVTIESKSYGVVGNVRVWDAESGVSLIEQPIVGEFESVQFSPDGKSFVTASVDNIARVWDAVSGEPLTEPMRHDSNVHSARFSPDGKRIVTASRDKTARVWDVQSGQPLTVSEDGKLFVNPSNSTPDGKRIVIVSGDAARVCDAQTGQPLTEPMKHDGEVDSAQFSRDGKRIVTVSGNAARVWDAQSGQPLTDPMRNDEKTYSAQFSPDGKRIVATSGDAARVWDAQTGQPLTEPMKHDAEATLAQFSPDGRWVVTASEDSTARVWDAQSGQPLTEPLKHDNAVDSAQFSPDGKRIVTASVDNTARVWDAQTGQPLTDPLKHDDNVLWAEFSPDGTRIVTASGHRRRQVLEGTARVWDAQSGQPLTESFKHDGAVNSARFSPDGKRIVTMSFNTARLWDISPEGKPMPEWLPRLAEAVAGQHLNDRGVFEPLKEDPGRVLAEIRSRLSRATADDDWTIWGRWFLADRSTRTISPFSKITVPEYIENQIEENTPESLAEAERLAVGNPGLLQRIERAKEVITKQAPPAATKEEPLAANESETIEMQEKALALHRTENGPDHPKTLVAMNKLANSYGDAGRWDEAFSLWAEASARLPKDTALALKIAALQVWFGKDADHAATSQRLLELAAGTADASTAERAAKAYCLRPSSDPQRIESALALARRAVDIGKGRPFLEWYQMALGMAEYRRGNYPEADQALGAAEEHEKGDPLVQDTARFFHAMSLFRQGKQAEARELFDKAVAQVKPLPADEKQPLANRADADNIIEWLAYKEAKGLLKPNAKTLPTKP